MATLSPGHGIIKTGMDIRAVRETIYRWFFAALAFAALVFLVGIILTLCKESWPFFARYSAFKALLGQSWYPTAEPAEFGMLPLITVIPAAELAFVRISFRMKFSHRIIIQQINQTVGPVSDS